MFCALYDIFPLPPKKQDFNCILNLQAASTTTEKEMFAERCHHSTRSTSFDSVVGGGGEGGAVQGKTKKRSQLSCRCVFNMTNTSFNVLKSWAIAQKKEKSMPE